MVKKCPKLLLKINQNCTWNYSLKYPNPIKMNLIVENSLKIYPDKRSNLHKGT